VTERLQAFLRSDAQVFDELSATAESPAVRHQLVAGAKKLAARLPWLPPDDLRCLLPCILQGVIILENNIQVMIRKSNLREVLEHGDQNIAASLVGLRKRVELAELTCLTIEAKRKRYGGEIHLVVPPTSNVPVRHPRPALIKAVVRSHGGTKILQQSVQLRERWLHFREQNFENSLYFSLLAGNLAGEELAPDRVHRQ